MTLEDLITAAVDKFQFRPRMKKETAAAYRVALTDHVERRDFTAGHELRIGRAHAEWTPEDIKDFQTRILKVPRVRQEFAPGQTPFAIPVLRTPPRPGSPPVSQAFLESVADAGLQAIIDRRRAEPDWTVPILISVMLWDGTLLATATTERGDRVAILKFMARNEPVFGFFIAADMIMHILDDTSAKRQEGIVMHVGTREKRTARVATYERTAAGIVFAAPYDMDMRGPDTIEDPYAEIFISTPPPAGPPS